MGTEKVLKSNTKKKIPTLRKGSSSKKAVISVKKKKITTLQKSLSSDDSKKDTLKKIEEKHVTLSLKVQWKKGSHQEKTHDCIFLKVNSRYIFVTIQSNNCIKNKVNL